MPKRSLKNDGMEEEWHGIKMCGEIPDDFLPAGWIGVYHISGGIIYLHQETRVVTWSRPYRIGRETSVKKHNVPSFSIPCLHQKLALEKDTSTKLADKDTNGYQTAYTDKIKRLRTNDNCLNNASKEEVETNDNCLNNVLKEEVETNDNCINNVSKEEAETNDNCLNNLSKEEVETNDNCLNNVSKEEVEIDDDCINNVSEEEVEMRVREGEIKGKLEEGEEEEEEAVLADNTEDEDMDERYLMSSNSINPPKLCNYLKNIFELKPLDFATRRKFVFTCRERDKQDTADITIEKKMNTTGKTYYQLLHEYCQTTLRLRPSIRKVDRRSPNDFTVEIALDDRLFGIASGDTIKEARHRAAAVTLNILDPTLLDNEESQEYIKMFDKLPIEDKNVICTIKEFDDLGDVKYPYQTLVHLLKRNFNPDFEKSEINLEFTILENGSMEYYMKFREYTAQGTCDDAKTGKHVASQTIIQLLYPVLKNWGSVMRLMAAYTSLNSLISDWPKTQSDAIVRVLKREMRKIDGAR